MGFLKIFELDFLTSTKSSTPKKTSNELNKKISENEELQILLNNMANNCVINADTASKNKVSERIKEPEVQEAIKRFNTMSKEERDKIIELADAKLQEKLMTFMETNGFITEQVEKTDTNIKQLNSKINKISKDKNYNETDLQQILTSFNSIAQNCLNSTEKIISSYNLYQYNKQNSCKNNVTFALNKCYRFKQSIGSYNNLMQSKIQEVIKALPEEKELKFDELMQTFDKIQTEIKKFENDITEDMNAYIPEAVRFENQFYGHTKKFVTNEMPSNLCLEDAVCENALIDALLEATNYTGAKLY